MRGTVSIHYGCSWVKCWARVVTSFPFPGLCMQRYPLAGYFNGFNRHHRVFSPKACIWRQMICPPSPHKHTHTHKVQAIIQDPRPIPCASPPEAHIHTHGPYTLSRWNHWHLHRKYCLWKNSKQNFLVRVLNTPLTN